MDNYKRVTAKPDQTYIWTYDMNLFKDPSVFITVCKIVVACMLLPYMLVFTLALFEGNLKRDFLALTQPFIYIILFMVILVAFSYYLVYIPLHGNHYIIIYDLTPTTITFIESKKDTKQNEIASSIGVIIGLLAGNPTTAGANLLALSKSEMTTSFDQVTKIIIYKHQHMKLISNDLTRNLICYHKDDQTFVESYIIDKCTKAKVIRK